MQECARQLHAGQQSRHPAKPGRFALCLERRIAETYVIAALVLLLVVCFCGCSRRGSSDLAQLMSEAKRGNPEAQFKIGMSYHEGMGLEQDYTKAAAWLQKSAGQAHSIAQFALGEMYLHGEGVLPDPATGGEWIEKSAKQGYAPAQDELAVLHSNGTGVPQDDFEAVKWAGYAADQGLPQAQHHLGFFLACKMPSKVPRDPVSACMWFKLAEAVGSEESRPFVATLEAQLTPAERSEVKRRVDQWNRAHPTSEWREVTLAQ